MVQKVPLNKRDTNWYSQYQKVKMEYQDNLNNFKFGLMQFDHKKNDDQIKFEYSTGLLNEYVYKNLLLNNSLANKIFIHPLIYTINDDNNVVYQVVKTHSSNIITKPIRDEMLIVKQESTKVYEILKDTYLSDSIYTLQFKNKSELENVIKNIEDDNLLMDKYFHNKSVRLYQKEKLFDMLFKNAFNEEPLMLYEDLNLLDNDLKVNIQMPTKVSLVDVTNSFYVEDNINRILHYEKYRIESWEAYLELSEEMNMNINKNKNDSTDL
jgi:hypothetical protein